MIRQSYAGLRSRRHGENFQCAISGCALVRPKDDYRVASGVRSPEALDSNGPLGLDLFDLRTFQRKVADQPFFVEYEAQDRLLQGFAVVCAAGALRYQSDLRIHTHIERVAGLEFLERLAGHEQQDLAALSRTQGQAQGCRSHTIVVNGCPTLQQGSVAVFAADAGAGLGDARKYQNARGFAEQLGMSRVGAGEAL